MDITKKAMLVNLSISQWTARAFDLKATKKVISEFKTKADSGKFNKLLVKQSSIKAVKRAANEARTYHYEMTLPWRDDNSRILPSTVYLKYTKKMRGFKSQFEAAVNQFVKDYPNLILEAQKDLNGLFNQYDYPKAGEIKSKFDFAVVVFPVPASNDFRVKLSTNEVDTIKKDIEVRVNASIHGAMREAWSRLYKSIKHMTEKTKSPDTVFRDSMIKNISELCDILPKLNITEDKDFSKFIGEAKKALAVLNPQKLRDKKTDRAAAHVKANDILERMGSYVGDIKEVKK